MMVIVAVVVRRMMTMTVMTMTMIMTLKGTVLDVCNKILILQTYPHAHSRGNRNNRRNIRQSTDTLT